MATRYLLWRPLNGIIRNRKKKEEATAKVPGGVDGIGASTSSDGGEGVDEMKEFVIEHNLERKERE